MKKIILLFIILILSACTPQVTVTLTPPPQIENTQIVPTPTETEMTIEETAQDLFAGQLTEVQIAALTPDQSYKIYQLAANWVVIDGKEINPNVLNESMRKELSIAVTEKRNEQSGPHFVTYVDESGAKLYLGPDGKFHSEPQAVENRKAKFIDDEGYIHIFDGEWIKIAGSNNIQYDDFENFPWPKTELTKILDEEDQHPLTMPEWLFKVGNGIQHSMLPIIVLSKETGEMNIVGLRDPGTLTVYIPRENDPYSVNMSIVIGSITLYADGVTAPSPGKISEFSNFWKALEANTLYYTIIETDQKANIAGSIPGSNGQEITDPYEGIATTNLTTDIITGKIESQDITLINTQAFVKKLGD